jgi:ATP-binding protein involved in chromosome partitioning
VVGVCTWKWDAPAARRRTSSLLRGKGGVGKTTVAVNLAIALSRAGSRVGVIDGDIDGPNVPIMLGIDAAHYDGKQIVPAEKYGVQVVSMGFLTQEDAAVIWRGPMLHGAIQQFFRDVAWKDLDYLIVDMPPGTGDVALSLSQTVPVAGAILVTTPQTVSLADTRRAVRMYQKLAIPALGLVENMSYYACPNPPRSDIFGHGGRIAHAMEIRFLAGCPCISRFARERQRRAADHQRTRIAGRARLPDRRGADGAARLPPIRSPRRTREDPPHPGPVAEGAGGGRLRRLDPQRPSLRNQVAAAMPRASAHRNPASVPSHTTPSTTHRRKAAPHGDRPANERGAVVSKMSPRHRSRQRLVPSRRCGK